MNMTRLVCSTIARDLGLNGCHRLAVLTLEKDWTQDISIQSHLINCPISRRKTPAAERIQVLPVTIKSAVTIQSKADCDWYFAIAMSAKVALINLLVQPCCQRLRCLVFQGGKLLFTYSGLSRSSLSSSGIR